MAVKRLGFNENFYPRSGPKAGSSYYQTVQTMQNRGRLGGPGAALAARSQALNKQHQLGDYARPAYQPRPTNAPDTAVKPTTATTFTDTQVQEPTRASPQAQASAYSYDPDPILQKVRAIGTQQRDDARASASKLRKELALDFGDEAFARSAGIDEATISAARDNPFSIQARLRRDYDEQSKDTTTGYDRSAADLLRQLTEIKADHGRSLEQGRSDLSREFTQFRQDRGRDYEEGAADLTRDFTQFRQDRGRDYEKDVADLNDSLNKANLWFGGHAGTERGRAADLYGQAEQRSQSVFDTETSRRKSDYEQSLSRAQAGYDTDSTRMLQDYEQSLGRAQAGYETTSGRLQGDYQDSLGRLATGFQQGGYDARGQAQRLFSQIDSELSGALLGADAEDVRAQEDAQQRALMEALRYGFDPGGGFGGGGYGGGGDFGAGGGGGGTPNPEPRFMTNPLTGGGGVAIVPGAGRQFDPVGDQIDLTRVGEIAAGSQPNAIVQALLADPRRQRRNILG